MQIQLLSYESVSIATIIPHTKQAQNLGGHTTVSIYTAQSLQVGEVGYTQMGSSGLSGAYSQGPSGAQLAVG